MELLRWATDASGKPSEAKLPDRRPDPAVRGSGRPEEASGQIAEVPPNAHDTPERSGPDQRTPTKEATAPAVAPLEYVSVVLLRSLADMTPEVFNASLRRRGRRDAVILPMAMTRDSLPAAESAFQIALGEARLEVAPCGHPLESAQLDSAVAQSWDWPEVAASVAEHEAHIVLRSVWASNEDRAEVVRLHQAAHAALAEFTPVAAVLWPSAGRLTRSPAVSDPGLSTSEPADLPRVCISYRSCRLEQGDSPVFVSDTVGLCGFGLPDVQVITHTEPDSEVSSLVYDLAQRFFFMGGRLPAGQVWQGTSGAWAMARAKAICPPEREVIQLTRCGGSGQIDVESPSDSAPPAGPSALP